LGTPDNSINRRPSTNSASNSAAATMNPQPLVRKPVSSIRPSGEIRISMRTKQPQSSFASVAIALQASTDRANRDERISDAISSGYNGIGMSLATIAVFARIK
jgi:hypothetical protein